MEVFLSIFFHFSLKPLLLLLLLSVWEGLSTMVYPINKGSSGAVLKEQPPLHFVLQGLIQSQKPRRGLVFLLAPLSFGSGLHLVPWWQSSNLLTSPRHALCKVESRQEPCGNMLNMVLECSLSKTPVLCMDHHVCIFSSFYILKG